MLDSRCVLLSAPAEFEMCSSWDHQHLSVLGSDSKAPLKSKFWRHFEQRGERVMICCFTCHDTISVPDATLSVAVMAGTVVSSTAAIVADVIEMPTAKNI